LVWKVHGGEQVAGARGVLVAMEAIAAEVVVFAAARRSAWGTDL
jgi:hypothetical protein